ncbi:TlpA disulfide reductase family protein [Pseudomonas sp. Ga0074129]|uniref:TlpA disulfide reductase family protein n=1 Tax=Pseudomonas sp. Ga0074129 TaxID=1752219 RepID=UPI000A6933CF|nr:TlpA disulfide reductase family protein [Pseudomonas sp. Ga0074129]
MVMRFQVIIRGIAALGLGLILAGCAQDIGVDQHGRKVAVERLEGQWLVINYWAQWCAPCRTEIPELNELDVELRDQSVWVLGVNFDALQGEKLSQATEEMGITFTVLAQDPAERFQLPRNEVLPVTYLIDPQGRMRERLLGEQSSEGLKARLAALKAEG